MASVRLIAAAATAAAAACALLLHARRRRRAVRAFAGYYENAYRLLFAYERHFAESQAALPHLQTVLPSGVIENDKALEPKAEKGLICYPYPQSMKPGAYDERRHRPPFVWRRADDGSFGVMQCWPTSYNAKFREEFAITVENPNAAVFSPQAADEFARVCTALFGTGALAKVPLRYCHRRTTNAEHLVYVGVRDALLAFLRATPAAVASLNIESVGLEGFVAGTIDGKGERGTKPFALAPEGEYALYVKRGWETMACVTPMEQFLRDRELLHEVEPGAFAL